MEAESPESPEKVNRTRSVIFRVTEDEKKMIEANAAAAGLDVSDFLRRLGMEIEIKPAKSADERRVLVGIANNLNQVARRVNSGHDKSQWLPQLNLILKRLDEYFL